MSSRLSIMKLPGKTSSSDSLDDRKGSIFGSLGGLARRKTQIEESGVFKLSTAELAFLPHEVRSRLGRSVGHLPPAPSAFKSRGAVLFVDVSGFTKLGAELKTTHGPEKGAEMLADEITSVLSMLTTVCLDYGGDVSKFAGDALLCVWEGGAEDAMFKMAKDCALEMLTAMHDISQDGVKLDIHGGLARGSILHFHLGSADDRLRWYLMAGEAMAGAACLVDASSPGEILCADTHETSRGARARSNTSNIAGFADAGRPNKRFSALTTFSAVGEDPQVSPRSSPRALWSPDQNYRKSSGVPDSPTSTNGSTARSAAAATDDEAADSFSELTVTRRRKGTITRNEGRNNIIEADRQARESGKLSISRGEVDLYKLNFQGMSRATMMGARSESMRGRGSSRPDASGSFQFLAGAGDEDAGPTIVVLTADTPKDDMKSRRMRLMTEDDPVLRVGLPRTCNVYIPAALRKGKIDDMVSEMKTGVSIVFVDVEDMALTDDEIDSQTISDEKLDALNNAFVTMTRITHAFGGEVRDMLFDDKGCVFIAVFGAIDDLSESGGDSSNSPQLGPAGRNPKLGALNSKKTSRAGFGGSFRSFASSSRGLPGNLASTMMESTSELRATKAAIAINSAVAGARIGVSTGTCFVGMCGIEKRHDFIVIGHDVNMAARLMVEADRSQVVCSADVYNAASKCLKFTEKTVNLQKKNTTTSSIAYVPDQSTAKRESFLAEYRYELFDADLFVGRAKELSNVEESINKMCLASSSHSGAIIIEGDEGMGKSSLVSRVRKMGKGRVSISHALAEDPYDEFHPWRRILESLTGLRPDMRVQEIKDTLEEFYSSSGGKLPPIDYAALALVLPFLQETAKANGNKSLGHVQLGGEGMEIANDQSRKAIAPVGRAVASLLALGNALSRKAGAKGVFVILENVEHMDPASLLLLDYLLDHIDNVKRLAVCLTIKSSAASHAQYPDEFQGHRLMYAYKLIEKANKLRNKLYVKLLGLSKEDANDLLNRALGQKVHDRVLDELYRISGGCPMHLTLLLQYCRERGFISRKDGAQYEWNGEPNSCLSAAAKQSIEGVVSVRFEEVLSETAKDVLKIAALSRVLEFDAIFLCEALKVGMNKITTASEVLAKLREARLQGFVVHIEDKTRPEREHAWRFKHEAIENAIVDTAEKTSGVIAIEEKLNELKKALILRLKLGYFGRVDDFEMV